MPVEGGLSLSRLIELVGNDHVQLEMLPQNITNAQRVKKPAGTHLTMFSQVFSPDDLLAWSMGPRGDTPRKVGFVVWMTEDQYKAAVAQWKQEGR